MDKEIKRLEELLVTLNKKKGGRAGEKLQRGYQKIIVAEKLKNLKESA
jgi:hypothetical protein